MSCIVYQTNHKTGAKYAYESASYWDKDKQQPRSKRKYIGKVDPVTNEIIRKKTSGEHSVHNDSTDTSGLPSLQEKIKGQDAVIAELREELKKKDAEYRKLLEMTRKAGDIINSALNGN